jgi:hypothetical protein
MNQASNTAPVQQQRNGPYWIGWAMTVLTALFLAMDAAMKFADIGPVREAQSALGYANSATPVIAFIELAALGLYLFPRTAVLGAILFTGVFGGAIASHLRVNDPLVSHTLFGVYLGLILWGGLWLRDAQLRALIPFKR